MGIGEDALRAHERWKGKLETVPKMRITTRQDLALAYTPGVAEPCMAIAQNPARVYDYTIKQNTVAVVSDGSGVLGLGNIGAEAALPVMEGKCVLFKEFADVNAFPVCIRTQDAAEIVSVVKNIAPAFGGINLEDISAPRCFEIEEQLQDLGIPVFHDDQHGTAIVVLAALMNALNVVGKRMQDAVVAISGAGAAGTAVARALLGADGAAGAASATTSGSGSAATVLRGAGAPQERVRDVIVVDRKGILHPARDGMNAAKRQLARITNKHGKQGTLADAMKGADVLIGVSAPGIVSEVMVRSMNKGAIVFAMANPVPEIMPDLAQKAGAVVVGTGRSDFPNQINNVLAFPGVFRGALEAKAKRITAGMKLAAAHALAACVEKPTAERIVPSALDKGVALRVAEAVRKKAVEEGVVRG